MLINGDCLIEMKKLETASFDAIVTDPPYGIQFHYHNSKDVAASPEEYGDWIKDVLIECNRVAKPGAFMAFWQSQTYLKYLWDWFGENIHIYVAAKNFVQLRPSAINYGWDPIVIWYKEGKPLKPETQERSVDFFVSNTSSNLRNRGLEKGHPCPKSIEQLQILIDNFVISNGIVLDPFMGSGSTGVACANVGRHFNGIEIDKQYFDLASMRIDEANKQLKFFDNVQEKQHLLFDDEPKEVDFALDARFRTS